MIHPSYTELIEAINTNSAEGKKPLSVAIDELYKGKVKILAPEEEDEEGTEQTAEAQTEESAQASEITETAETAEETTEE